MNGKTDLKDVSFLIPIRIDSVVRLENLLMVVDYLISNFNTNIHILEASSYNNDILNRLVPDEVSLTYEQDHDPIFHRTKYINMLVDKSRTSYLAIWDTDVIVPTDQIIKSVNSLRKSQAKFVFPYKDYFLDTTKIFRELFLQTRDLNVLIDNKERMNQIHIPNPLGGAFLVDKNAYIKFGKENEAFYGWGNEDADRLNRCKIMGYNYKRVQGPLFHLTHGRGINSRHHSDEQGNIKFSEVFRIFTMSKNELEAEIKSWDN